MCAELPAQTTAQLRMQLIVPVSTPDGKREIAVDRYPRLYVLLTNISPRPVKLWKDWNTWGYFNLTLQWTAGGQTRLIRRKAPKNWDGDFSDFWVLPPNESVILEIDMSSGEWEGIPDLYGETIPATLRAVYENKPDALATEFGVWVGRIATEPVEVVFK
ncbi:MAG: hypothetical protein EAZ89_06395 [Bacteroidetes bacterium]|nr:MAG: hypothetical protein EAZ89_06395 [Bacteroidota bacterium]